MLDARVEMIVKLRYLFTSPKPIRVQKRVRCGFRLSRLLMVHEAAVACLLCLGWNASLRAQSLDAYGGALSLQCGPNTKAVTSAISTVARASGTVTLTFSVPHRFIVNDTLTVGGTTADSGSFNTPAGQLFTVVSVPSSTTVTYSQGGKNVNATPNAGTAELARYYVSKVGSRWWLCTPLGNAMWMNAVADAEHNSNTDYQNINDTQLVHAKYAKGVTTSNVDNWAYQTALRLKTWRFNVLAELGDGNIFPSTVGPAWQTPDHTIPPQARIAFMIKLNPILYSGYNMNGYGPGPTKCELGLYKRSIYSGAMRAMADIFDANFSKWLVGALANGLAFSQFTGPHHEYLFGFVGDESDVTGGLMAGPDFHIVTGGGTSKPNTAVIQTGTTITDPHWGWITLISSPVQAAASRGDTPKGLAPHDLVYADTKVYTKGELGTWLQQTGDRGPGYASIAALNAGWGSNYDTFGSDAVTRTETCATGNGTRGPYTCTLPRTPVTPLTVQVKVGGVLAAGDDGAGAEAKVETGTGNFRSISGTKPIGSITYSSGGISLTFNTAVPSGTAITVTYQTNGWGQGSGLLDEDGTCPSRGHGQGCWIPAKPYWTANETENQIQKDLDGFLFHFAKSYFATVKGDIEAAAPGYLYSPVDLIGGYGCPPRREVLEAAALYADLLPFDSIPASDPTGVVTDQQERIDFVARYAGDMPWINYNFMIAQADSYFPASEFPVTNTLSFSTQQARGQYYQMKTGAQLDTTVSAGCNCGFAGTYPIVGQSWWQLYDDPKQKANYGLLTLRDDPYDGIASTPSPGVDQWGYVTGCQGAFALPGPTTPCEQGSYGDALTSIVSANGAWLAYAVP